MINEKDYCDYDTCVALKRLGYDFIADFYYSSREHVVSALAVYRNHFIPKIHLFDAQKWLRQKKGLHISVDYQYSDTTIYEYTIRTIDYRGKMISSNDYEIFEDALLEAVKECINILNLQLS